MPQKFSLIVRVVALCAVAGCVSGCTDWVERQADRASVAIDCAVLAAAKVPKTGQMAHCDRHPAART